MSDSRASVGVPYGSPSFALAKKKVFPALVRQKAYRSSRSSLL
ncbi:hypothetical protein [Streptomyces sp. x-45]